MDGAGYGGGQRFDWQKQLHMDRQAGIFAGRKFVLAGGLHAGNVAEGIRLFDPDIVDVSSGVENDNGIGKNRDKIMEFVRKVKEHE